MKITIKDYNLQYIIFVHNFVLIFLIFVLWFVGTYLSLTLWLFNVMNVWIRMKYKFYYSIYLKNLFNAKKKLNYWFLVENLKKKKKF
jgi:hypothetical protein